MELTELQLKKWNRDMVVNWLVNNDFSYGMQRRKRRYAGIGTSSLKREILARLKIENGTNTIYKPFQKT